ncbi:hypothetical protein AB0I54_06230 [Streptomyces sp. NPDC050625]|uniref:hypothetical protein n=1 Tax=Streptomyces sp. NPDC050625 TaxID=3154629 RepID=UPI0034165BC2
MSRVRAAKQEKKKDPAAEEFAAGVALLRSNPALRAVEFTVCRHPDCGLAPREGLVRADADGDRVLPAWFLIEAARDMPRLVEARR